MENIGELFKRFGSQDYIGEKISQTAHAEQAAAAAVKDGWDDAFVIACLLHDIGHLIALNEGWAYDQWGAAHHEQIARIKLMQWGFPERVVELVRRHVDAKRYLTWKNPDYLSRLSAASQATLQQQGGPFSAEEALAFERHPWFQDILKMRRYDDEAKVIDKKVPSWETYQPMMEELMSANACSSSCA